jgi:hypothetical protein
MNPHLPLPPFTEETARFNVHSAVEASNSGPIMKRCDVSKFSLISALGK